MADKVAVRAWVGGGVLVKSTCWVTDFFPLHRYISTYLNVQERDPKAHRFLGQIYEAEDNIEKAFGCYKVSTMLSYNPWCSALFLYKKDF